MTSATGSRVIGQVGQGVNCSIGHTGQTTHCQLSFRYEVHTTQHMIYDDAYINIKIKININQLSLLV